MEPSDQNSNFSPNYAVPHYNAAPYVPVVPSDAMYNPSQNPYCHTPFQPSAPPSYQVPVDTNPHYGTYPPCDIPPYSGTTATHPYSGITATHPYSGITATHPYNGITATHPYSGITATHPYSGTTAPVAYPLPFDPLQMQQIHPPMEALETTIPVERETKDKAPRWNPFKKGEMYDLYNGPLKRSHRTDFGMVFIFPIFFAAYLLLCGFILFYALTGNSRSTFTNASIFTQTHDYKGRRCGRDSDVYEYPFLYFPSEKTLYYSLSNPLPYEKTIGVCTDICPETFETHRNQRCPEDSAHYCTWYSNRGSIYDENYNMCIHPRQFIPKRMDFDESMNLEQLRSSSVFDDFYLTWKLIVAIPLIVAAVALLFSSYPKGDATWKNYYGFYFSILGLIVSALGLFLFFWDFNSLHSALLRTFLVIIFPTLYLLLYFLFRPMQWHLLAIEKIRNLKDSFKEDNSSIALLPYIFYPFLLAIMALSLASCCSLYGAGVGRGLNVSLRWITFFTFYIVFMTIWLILILYHFSVMVISYAVGEYYFSMKYAGKY